LHNSRFLWTQKTLKKISVRSDRVVEIGCFDGRLLQFLPNEPTDYQGLDAGWEGGLYAAQDKYAGHANWHFHKAGDPSALNRYEENSFDLAAALETMEHVPPEMVDGYLAELARVVDGYLLVSVPNEKGPIFLAKWLAKKLFFGGAEPYNVGELISAFFGRLDKVERNEHKGFDYHRLVQQIDKHFDIVAVEGIPFRIFPPSLSFTVGIIARTSRQK